MNAKDKLQRANLLLELYGPLLTKKQLAIMKDKYIYDLSFQEISDHFHISRSAARDAIKVATNKLEEYEKVLNLLSKRENVLKLITDKKLKEKVQNILCAR